jgi:hypothetical protein
MSLVTTSTALLLLAFAASCRPSPVDRGGAATGDDLGGAGNSGAGSAAANDSFRQQVPSGDLPRPAHDKTGRDTIGSYR